MKRAKRAYRQPRVDWERLDLRKMVRDHVLAEFKRAARGEVARAHRKIRREIYRSALIHGCAVFSVQCAPHAWPSLTPVDIMRSPVHQS